MLLTLVTLTQWCLLWCLGLKNNNRRNRTWNQNKNEETWLSILSCSRKNNESYLLFETTIGIQESVKMSWMKQWKWQIVSSESVMGTSSVCNLSLCSQAVSFGRHWAKNNTRDILSVYACLITICVLPLPSNFWIHAAAALTQWQKVWCVLLMGKTWPRGQLNMKTTHKCFSVIRRLNLCQECIHSSEHTRKWHKTFAKHILDFRFRGSLLYCIFRIWRLLNC